MGRVILMLPRLGETMEEAKVIEWIVAPGETYGRGDVLLEVETDKTVVEVPALADGTLIKQLAAPGDVITLDAGFAEVSQQADAPIIVAKDTPANDQAIPAKHLAPKPITGYGVAASPAARAMARRLGVSLPGLTGTGRRGRITAEDVVQSKGTVVLLHGLFDDKDGWRGLPQRLAKHGARAVALDLPGHGDDTSRTSEFDTAVDELADRLPIGPVHLVGHSLGAAFAARLAVRSGGNALSLTLFAPFGLGGSICSDFLRQMEHADEPKSLGQALTFLGGGPLSDTALAQQLEKHTRGRAAGIAWAKTMADNDNQRIDITADIAAAPCPVTVVFGTDDRILDWRDVANLSAETRIHLIPNAGHLPHLVRPDLAVALIAPRLDRGGQHLKKQLRHLP